MVGRTGVRRTMTSVLIVNPNTTASMTEAVVRHAEQSFPCIRFVGVTARFGEPVIASRVSFVVGAHAALDAVKEQQSEYDAVMIACFGDPGLEAVRECCNVPVAGMMEAALTEAKRYAQPYRIVTAGSAWHDMLWERARALRLADKLTAVQVLPATGLAAASNPLLTLSRLQPIVDEAANQGERVVLGGAGFVGLRERLGHAACTIDGVDAALRALLTSIQN